MRRKVGCDILEMMDGLMPPQDKEGTVIHRFFDELRRGRLVTTRCKGCGTLLWHPRAVCPNCLSKDLTWERLPTTGTVYAFTTVGQKGKAQMTVSLVELEGTSIRLFTPIEASYEELCIGTKVSMRVRRVRGGGVRYVFRPESAKGGKGRKGKRGER